MANFGPPVYVDFTRSSPLEADETEIMGNSKRYPYCIVWTPIPVLTWIFPFIGHMGICTSNGIIRDFAGSYYVSENDMGFGDPTKKVQLDVDKVHGMSWDEAVQHAAQVYCSRTHNLLLDNCHSMVALALNKMKYDGSTSWNMVNLCILVLLRGRYVSFSGYLKSNLPFLIFISFVILAIVLRSM